MNKPYICNRNTAQGPYRIKDIVRRCLRTWGISGSAAAQKDELGAIWQEIAGQEAAFHTRVIGLRRGILRVEVNSAARLQELASFKKAPLLEALKRALPKRHIRDIRFILGFTPAATLEQKENLQ